METVAAAKKGSAARASVVLALCDRRGRPLVHSVIFASDRHLATAWRSAVVRATTASSRRMSARYAIPLNTWRILSLGKGSFGNAVQPQPRAGVQSGASLRKSWGSLGSELTIRSMILHRFSGLQKCSYELRANCEGPKRRPISSTPPRAVASET